MEGLTKDAQVGERGVDNPVFVSAFEDAPPSYPAATAPSSGGGGGGDDGMRAAASMSAEEIRAEQRRIWRNLIAICLSFMFVFTAYQSMSNLQSSINEEDGLGVTSLSVLYAAIMVSCMFVPTWLISKLGCKWTIVCCQLCYSAYIGAQFYPTFGTLIPGAIILGLGAAPMWSAKCTYLTQVGNRYSQLSGEKTPEPCVSRFFGVFFMIFQTSSIWGNLISSLVLSNGVGELDESQLSTCGANYCNQLIANSSDSVKKDNVYTLAGIYLGSALLGAAIVAIFVEPLTNFGEAGRQGSGTGKSGFELAIATFRHLKNPYQLLIIPLTMWSGFEQAFLSADFTKAFITCSWGVWNVGFVLICYGAADAVGSVVSGSLVRQLGRVPIFLFGAVVNAALVVTLLFWRPDPSQAAVFYVIAALWGVCDAIWQTQINAFYGVIFLHEEEAAFSNYRMWESLGFIIPFAYSTVLCASVKMYVLLGVLGCGMVGYLTIEWKERQRLRQAPAK